LEITIKRDEEAKGDAVPGEGLCTWHVGKTGRSTKERIVSFKGLIKLVWMVQ
jgi:hypothetical protein